MDLFVVNRHIEIEEPGNAVREQANLDKVLKRIERNKKIRSRRRERLKDKGQQKKKITKPEINQIPENQNDFIDKDFDNSLPVEREIVKSKRDHGSLDGFTVLGVDTFDKKAKVKRVLPKWLSNPTVISVNLQNLESKVSTMKELDKSLRTKLRENKIKYFFPVQAQVIPWLLKANKNADILFPRDVCVSAPTGSGKTLAFVLPIVQALKHRFERKIRALVILPTQDLAMQVFKMFKKYSQDTNISVWLITGRSSFPDEQKQLLYKNEAFGYISKVDILVCTAGRLVEHIKSTKGFDLHSLEFLVIDEADRVLDNVQNDWLYHLEKHINPEGRVQASQLLNLCTLKKRRPPQKLLFSATLSQDPEKLKVLSLFQPKLFTSITESDIATEKDENITEKFVGKYTMPKELKEKFIVCSLDLKPLVLYQFLKMERLTKTMIFTHSVESVHRLTILLKSLFKTDMKIEEISSTLESKYRNSLIDKFSNGDIDILVCTDTLARGIDLASVQCVISYSAPKHLETYIHRAGRTARAGESGLAVTILENTQVKHFQGLLNQADKNIEEIKISEADIEPLGSQYEDALNDLKATIGLEETKDLLKMKSKRRAANHKTKRKRLNTNP